MRKKYLIYADLETASECDLKAAGAYKYAEHPSTRVQMFSYLRKGESKASLWVPEEGQKMPKDLKRFIEDPNCIFMFHNAQFDRILLHTLGIAMPVQRFRCMMIQAMSHSLPGGLEALGTVLKIDEDKAKMKDGKRLVLMFCKPQKNAKTGALTWRTYETNPDEWEQYKEYCKRDTEVMPLIHGRLPAFNYPKHPELDYWFLDQDLNDRGMPVDLELVDAAQRAIDDTRVRLDKQTVELTEGEVQAATQRDALMDYLKDTYGMDIDDMKKSTVERLLDDPETSPAIRELLILRRASTTSSTAKYKKMRAVACSDGRIRGAIQFNGAKRTARDAGRMVQPQNFPSRGLLKHKEVMMGIKALKHDMAYDLGFDVMHLASSALRYTIAAPKGKKFVIADLSAIEGRGLSWVADEKWKVQAYQESDADPKAPDLYMLSYAKSFKVDPRSVSKDDRQIGKVLELSMGYGGGVGAFVNFASAFKIDLEALSDKLISVLPDDVFNEAQGFYDWAVSMELKTFGLSKTAFSAIDATKRLWRSGHPATCKFWADVEDAVRQALMFGKPGKLYPFSIDGFATEKYRNWIFIHMPSGRRLCYPGMQMTDNGRRLVFQGENQFTKQWSLIPTGGPKCTENIVQAISRDIFKHGQKLADEAGYKTILVVHDELVCEVPDSGEFTVSALEGFMSEQPPWAKSLPLAAKGFETYRYHKED